MPLVAQQVRARSTTTARYIALTPLVVDSTGNFAAAQRQSATPLTQDIEVSAWDLGLTGLRGYGLLRLRGALGSDLVWPRSTDHADALSAFLELERPRWRARAGRQQRVSALGLTTFDGAAGLWRPRPAVRVEAFGGRGLARGYLEPLSSDAIRAIEPLRPGQGTMVVGASVWTARAGWSGGAAWQREILADRSGLVGERAGVDVQGPLGRHVGLTALLHGDLAAGAVARARVALGWRVRRAFVEAEVFHYRPLFDLTTIWGAFAPDGHRGAGLRVEVPWRRYLAGGAITQRRYRPATETTPFLAGVGDTRTQLELGARRTGERLVADAQWRLSFGYGGAHSGADVHLAWRGPADAWRAGFLLTAFQEQEQFRVADGTVFGLGADARGRLARRVTARAEVSRYWHRPSAGDVTLDWSQLRGLLALEWTFGADADRARPR